MRSGSVVVLVIALAACTASAEMILFQDSFDTFSLGTTWQATAWGGATGAPDVKLLGGQSHGGELTLDMGSGNDNAEFKGIETVSSIPIDGMVSLTLDVRTTAANAHLPIEATLLGESGDWAQMYYTYTAWTNNYSDSAGNSDALGSWPSGMTPGTYRRFVITADLAGVTAEVYDQTDTLRWSQSFTSFNLSDLGDSVDVLLRQQKGLIEPPDGHYAPLVYVDQVTLTGYTPEPTTLTLLALGGLGLAVRRRRARN